MSSAFLAPPPLGHAPHSDDIDLGQQTAEICVLFEDVEKYITGVTRRTTCDDVVYALIHKRLRERNSTQRPLEAMRYYTMFLRMTSDSGNADIRPLIGRSKILKVLRSSATSRDEVTFVVRKCEFRGSTTGTTDNEDSITPTPTPARVASISAQSPFYRKLQQRRRRTSISSVDAVPRVGPACASPMSLPLESAAAPLPSRFVIPTEYDRLLMTIVQQERDIEEQKAVLRTNEEHVTDDLDDDLDDDHEADIRMLMDRLTTLDTKLAFEQAQVIRLTQIATRERQLTPDIADTNYYLHPSHQHHRHHPTINTTDHYYTTGQHYDHYDHLSDADLHNELTNLRSRYQREVSLHLQYDGQMQDNECTLTDLQHQLCNSSVHLQALTTRMKPPSSSFLADTSSGVESGQGSNDNSTEFPHTNLPEHLDYRSPPPSYDQQQDAGYYGAHDHRNPAPQPQPQSQSQLQPSAALTTPLLYHHHPIDQRPPRWVSPLVSPIQEYHKSSKLSTDGPGTAEDNNSDTGLSSMHSDEPLTNRLLVTLV